VAAVIALALLVTALAMVLLWLLETDPATPRHGLDSPSGTRPPVVPNDSTDPGPVNYDG
jgi:hypothetical protein